MKSIHCIDINSVIFRAVGNSFNIHFFGVRHFLSEAAKTVSSIIIVAEVHYMCTKKWGCTIFFLVDCCCYCCCYCTVCFLIVFLFRFDLYAFFHTIFMWHGFYVWVFVHIWYAYHRHIKHQIISLQFDGSCREKKGRRRKIIEINGNEYILLNFAVAYICSIYLFHCDCLRSFRFVDLLFIIICLLLGFFSFPCQYFCFGIYIWSDEGLLLLFIVYCSCASESK